MGAPSHGIKKVLGLATASTLMGCTSTVSVTVHIGYRAISSTPKSLQEPVTTMSSRQMVALVVLPLFQMPEKLLQVQAAEGTVPMPTTVPLMLNSIEASGEQPPMLAIQADNWYSVLGVTFTVWHQTVRLGTSAPSTASKLPLPLLSLHKAYGDTLTTSYVPQGKNRKPGLCTYPLVKPAKPCSKSPFSIKFWAVLTVFARKIYWVGWLTVTLGVRVLAPTIPDVGVQAKLRYGPLMAPSSTAKVGVVHPN